MFEDVYWEEYDDQDGTGFTHVGYTDINGEDKFEEIGDDLEMQVVEIRRCNGRDTRVKLYRANVPAAV